MQFVVLLNYIGLYIYIYICLQNKRTKRADSGKANSSSQRTFKQLRLALLTISDYIIVRFQRNITVIS